MLEPGDFFVKESTQVIQFSPGEFRLMFCFEGRRESGAVSWRFGVANLVDDFSDAVFRGIYSYVIRETFPYASCWK